MKFDPSLPIYRSLRYRLKKAFNEPPNLLGLAGAVALSAATLNPLPLIIGAVVEAAYLLFVPDSNWYLKRMEAQFDGEVVARREQLKEEVFPMVPRAVHQEFARLEKVREQIVAQSRTEEPWFREALRKLDFLMEKFLQFSQKEAQFGTYIAGVYNEVYQRSTPDQRRMMRTPPAPPKEVGKPRGRVVEETTGGLALSQEWIEAVTETIKNYYSVEMDDLGQSVEEETVLANRTLMEKRLQILGRRKDFIERVAQILANLRLQSRLISDTFGLINDEIRARSPEQVLSDIDEVMTQATSLTEAIDEMTPMTEMVGTY